MFGRQDRRTAGWSERIGILAVAAAFAYGAWPVEWILDRRLSARRSFVSELGALTQPDAWVFNSLDLVAGVIVVALAFALAREIRGGQLFTLGCVCLGVFGAGDTAEALLPMDCAPSLSARCLAREASGHGISWHDRGHTIGSVASIVAVLLSMALIGWAMANAPGWRWIARPWLVAAPPLAVLSMYVGLLTLDRRLPGALERLMVTSFSLWVFTLGAVLLAAQHSRAQPSD